MGLDPNYTPEQIQRIQTQEDPRPGVVGAGAAGESTPPPEADPQNKAKTLQKLRAPVWKHFVRGETKADDTYDATCKYCKNAKFEMGKQRGTNSMRHHLKKGCTTEVQVTCNH